MHRRHPGVIILGVILAASGGWLAASALGLPLLPGARLWPLMVTAGGAALLAENASQRRPSAGFGFLGAMLVPLGAILLVFTLGIGGANWQHVLSAWPVGLVLLGWAALAVYLMEGMGQEGLLVVAFLVGGVGLAALPFTMGAIRAPAFSQVTRFWPAALALGVIALGLGVRARRHRRATPDEQA